ncbi:response regulator transcription factor [Promicromonospora sp. NPDC023987]|uniref:response regulator transcription factor n=1 Tax=Promicromonospora sp. NPDC023987 TaxID=3155360 RepID=UPI003401F271
MRVRVLVVDDDPRVRDVLTGTFATDPDIDVVARAADGREALAVARSRLLDVVVLDVRMPVLDGLGTLEVIRREQLPVRVVVLTSFGESEYVRRAIALGADGFLLKSGDPHDLLRAVRGTAEGETWLSPAVAHQVARDLRRGDAGHADAELAAGRLAALTARERDVADLLAQGRTNAEIATDLHLSESTVKAYVSSAMDRLGVRNRVELAWQVWSAGQRTSP